MTRMVTHARTRTRVSTSRSKQNRSPCVAWKHGRFCRVCWIRVLAAVPTRSLLVVTNVAEANERTALIREVLKWLQL